MGSGNKKKRYRICKYVLGAGKKVNNIMTGGEWNFPSVLPYAVYYVKTGSDQIGQHL